LAVCAVAARARSPRRHGDLIVSSLNFDILDLTGIAVAVEADDDTRDAGERQRIEQHALVEGEQFGFELGLGDRLHLPVGERRNGLGGSSGCVGHEGLLKRKCPARRPGGRFG